MSFLKLNEEIIYQHLLREFIERAKALKKDYLLMGSNYLAATLFLKNAAKNYIFYPIVINRVIDLFDKKIHEQSN